MSCSAVPAGGCRSSGWGLVLLARLSLVLVGGVVFWLFCRYSPLSSGTSVPCTRSPESAGQFFVNFVMGLMVGDRRFPEATILGVEFLYFLRQPSGGSPADRFRTF